MVICDPIMKVDFLQPLLQMIDIDFDHGQSIAAYH